MTHHIAHQYDEILNAGLPGLEVHIVYNCESEIVFDQNGGEESNRLIHIAPVVDGHPSPFQIFPRESGSSDERAFLGVLRESARQALWAEALRQAGDRWEGRHKIIAAHCWQVNGTTTLPTFGKPEFFAG